MNRYAKLFALAKQLGIEKDDLSAGAAFWTGQESLRSLNDAALREYESKLSAQISMNFHDRRRAIEHHFYRNPLLSGKQFAYFLDLIADVFLNIYQFRVWLKRYYNIDSETQIDSELASKIIVALSEMRKRGYKT